MLSTAEASAAIAAAMPAFDPEVVTAGRAAGRVLREHVIAERDQPPFDRVTMDGIAIAFDGFERGTRRFAVQATQHAGEPLLRLAAPTQCIEVMTGAILPAGSDCVIPVERLRIRDGYAEFERDYLPERHQFVHPRASDHRVGTTLLSPGRVISPVDVAIIVSCGLTEVAVTRRPAVSILSTGSELVPAGRPVEPHQVRLSNGPAVKAMLERDGFDDCREEHLPDEPHTLESRIGHHLDTAGVLILSGGVSMGKADFVPQILARLGVETVFHGISQRPGKPMWFGMGAKRQAVFALPGNPVSTLVCCRHYVLPALLAASGRTPAACARAVLTEDVTFRPELTYFLPVRTLSDVDGVLRAKPVPTNTSGDFTALRDSDGYLELARDQSFFPRGSPLPLHPWSAA